MKKCIFMSSVLAVTLLFTTQKVTAQKTVWKYVTEQQMPRNDDYRTVHPKKYLTYQLDVTALKMQLAKAPMEFTEEAKIHPLILEMPMPDGKMQRFSVVESPMQEPELAAKFPEIKTYSAIGIDDPYAIMKLDWGYIGFHGFILSQDKAPIQIDPYFKNRQDYYITYSIADQQQIPYYEGTAENEQLSDLKQHARKYLFKGHVGKCYGDTLRTYKLAIACTHEYAAAVCRPAAVTQVATHNAIVAAYNRVNGIYESELAIRFTLVANNNLIEFIAAGSSAFTTNGPNATIANRGQRVIDSLIGNANYDIGHTVCTGFSGGVGFFAVVCQTGSKAKGTCGRANPTSDTFSVGYLAHEIGHQFDARHTWNSPDSLCTPGEYSGTSAVEPGSGVTIMSYQGQCGSIDNLENHELNLPNFHAWSLEQITTLSRGTAGTCPNKTLTRNDIPSVNAGADQVVPVSTPFVLTGTATDADPILYSWEEIDPGGTQAHWNAGSAPFFRTFAPVTTGTRYFPKQSDVARGTSTVGEFLPTAPVTLNFRLTVRDRKAGGGAVCSEDITVTFAGAAPFRVTSQTAATNWTGNGVNTAIITWDVAGTNAAPFNCDSVQIYLSTDSGYTFPILIKTARNSGNDTIVIPSIATTRGRIMVRGKGKAFYSINRGNITINVCLKPAVSIRISDTVVCANKKVTFTANGSNITANPVYQWKKNGNNVGGNASSYIDSTLANGDSVWVVVTSNEACKITTGVASNKIKVKVRTVRPIAIACPINATLCVGDTMRFSANPAGGVWSQMGRVTIDPATGFMTGTSAGITTIRYTITDTGCSNTASCNLTVVATLATPTIKYASGTTNTQGSGGLCTNRTFTLVGTPGGGTWSSTGAINVTNAGVVTTTGVTGASSVTYTIGTGNCKASRTISMAVVACASRGISSSNQFNKYTLYPNPARDFANLQMDKLVNGTIAITDLYGKELRRQTINSKLQRLNIEGLSKGMYFVTIATNENKVTEKLLIE